MPDALKILLGAGLALAAGIWTQLFVAKQNELTQRIDELVKLIWEYADLSSRYWSGEFKKLDHNKTEARMVAMDHFIGSMISEMAATNGRFQMQGDLDRCLFNLSDCATGGNFQVKGRPNDQLRSADAYTVASELCLRLRTERRKLIKLF